MEWRPVFNKGLEKLRIKEMLEGFTVKDLQMIKTAAIKLDILDWETQPTVDTVYEIALRLSIFESDIVSPTLVMNKIKEYVEANQ